MELGDEVSVKIKSAIRARLKELGIVWDRELPDYVMVLIANKKSKEQMENDLTIFLGSHTSGFTAWLHNVLKKLEECTIYRGLTKKKEEEKKSKSKRRPSDENQQEFKKLKGIDDEKCDDNGNLNAASDSGSEGVIPHHHSPVRIEEGVDSDVSDFSTPTLELSDMKLSSSVNHSNSIERLNNDLNNIEKSTMETFVAEGRLEKEVIVEKPKPKEKIEISWSSENNAMDYTAVTKRFSPVKRSGSRGRGERDQSRSKSRSRTRSQPHFDQSNHVSVLKRTFMKENLRKEDERRPYRASRGNFRRRNSEERRNGYEKNSRAIGKMRNEKDIRKRCGSRDAEVDKLPSLVKVTPRPVRPPAMQPSSNLILKAVAEAQKSIATSSLPQPDDKVVEKKEKNRMSRKAIYRKKKVPAFQRENISVTLLNDRVIADKIREEDGETLMFENNIRKHENQFNDGPEVERFTISLVSDDNDSLIASDFEENASEEKVLTEENYSEPEQNVVPLSEPMDISSTTIVEENMEEEADLRDFPGQQRFDRRRLGPRVIPDADTVLSFDESGTKHCDDVRKWLPKEVITCKYCSHVLSRGLAPMDDSITKTIMNENVYAAADGKTDENGKVIKCKFWPTCEAGNDCRFYHPKEYCRTLPNCKFGQKCLYYHPPCKFADKCLNVTCPYTHTPVPAPTVKAKVWTKVPLAPSNAQICMYYPNCKKPFCPYQHSFSATTAIPCKFGINCTKGTCEFDHTHLAKNPYKWVNHNPE